VVVEALALPEHLVTVAQAAVVSHQTLLPEHLTQPELEHQDRALQVVEVTTIHPVVAVVVEQLAQMLQVQAVQMQFKTVVQVVLV
jgi:hypothetical protein